MSKAALTSPFEEPVEDLSGTSTVLAALDEEPADDAAVEVLDAAPAVFPAAEPALVVLAEDDAEEE